MQTPDRRRVLVVEDERELRDSLAALLSKHFEVCSAANGHEALEMARQQSPHIILMDLRMPEMNGFEACMRLRESEQTKDVPVLILSGQDEVHSRIQAFKLGADDFIAKPFEIGEILVRIESKLKRKESFSKPTLTELLCGNLRLKLEGMEVQIAGNVVELSALEFRLLRFFLENQGRVIERPQILKSIWGNVVVAERTVDTHIASLRRKLKGFNHRFESIYGVGYVLRDEISTVVAG